METVLGILLAIGAALCLGLTAVSVRIGTSRGGSDDALVVVLAVNVLLLVPTTAIRYYPDYSLTGVSIAAFAGAGLVGTMLGRAFFFKGIERIGASRAEPIKASMPLHATIIAVLVLGEHVGPGRLAGIVLIVVGVAAISWESRGSSGDEKLELTWIGFLFPLLAAVLYGIDPTLAKLGFAEGTPVFVGLSIKTLAAVVAFAGYLRLRGALQVPSPTSESFRWYIAGGVANTLFLIFSYSAYDLVPVSLAVPILQTSPIVVAVISYVYLQHLERVNLRLVAGMGTVVFGAVLVTLFS